MTAAEEELLEQLSEVRVDDKDASMAYNIRRNGELFVRKITDDVTIASKKDGKGIDIFVKENTKYAVIYIPVIVSMSGLDDLVYNDFHIGKNAKAIIIAGCGIHNEGKNDSRHVGIHRFFLDEHSNVKYVEKHYGSGHGHGNRVLDPTTELELKKGATMEIETFQIDGVDTTIRETRGVLYDDATLTITEKVMTRKEQTAKTSFELLLEGKNSRAHIVSRAVAEDKSSQVFLSNVVGNNLCYGHVECDAILKDEAFVQAIPEITARHVDANLIHEATIGKIAGDQLIKLMSLGLSEKEAEEEIIKGFLH